jgi:hypothetical protein
MRSGLAVKHSPAKKQSFTPPRLRIAFGSAHHLIGRAIIMEAAVSIMDFFAASSFLIVFAIALLLCWP